jgi:hypothetical protein
MRKGPPMRGPFSRLWPACRDRSAISCRAATTSADPSPSDIPARAAAEEAGCSRPQAQATWACLAGAAARCPEQPAARRAPAGSEPRQGAASSGLRRVPARPGLQRVPVGSGLQRMPAGSGVAGSFPRSRAAPCSRHRRPSARRRGLDQPPDWSPPSSSAFPRGRQFCRRRAVPANPANRQPWRTASSRGPHRRRARGTTAAVTPSPH